MKQKLLKSIKLAARSTVQIFIMLRSSTLACVICVGAVGGGSVLVMNYWVQRSKQWYFLPSKGGTCTGKNITSIKVKLINMIKQAAH